MLDAAVKQLELAKLGAKINFSHIPRTLLQQEAAKLIEGAECCGSQSIHYRGAGTVFEAALSPAGNCRMTSQFCEPR